MLNAALIAEDIQNAQEGFLPRVFHQLRGTKAASEFDHQQRPEIACKMSFGIGIALSEPIYIVLVKHLTLQAPSDPVDTMVQR